MSVASRYATHQEVEFKCLELRSQEWSSFLKRSYRMEVGCFYYLSDQYFVDFPDKGLMRNKESVDGQDHDRPCFYAFQDKKTGYSG